MAMDQQEYALRLELLDTVSKDHPVISGRLTELKTITDKHSSQKLFKKFRRHSRTSLEALTLNDFALEEKFQQLAQQAHKALNNFKVDKSALWEAVAAVFILRASVVPDRLDEYCVGALTDNLPDELKPIVKDLDLLDDLFEEILVSDERWGALKEDEKTVSDTMYQQAQAYLDDAKQTKDPLDSLQTAFAQMKTQDKFEEAGILVFAMSFLADMDDLRRDNSELRDENMDPAIKKTLDDLLAQKASLNGNAELLKEIEPAGTVAAAMASDEGVVKRENPHKLIPLEAHDSPFAKAFKGPAFRMAQIVSISIDGAVQDISMPANLAKDWDGPTLRVKCEGYPHVLCLTLEAQFMKEKKTIHNAYLKFWPAGIFDYAPQMRDFSVEEQFVKPDPSAVLPESSEESEEASKEAEEASKEAAAKPTGFTDDSWSGEQPEEQPVEDKGERFIIIKFTTNGGIGHQLDYVKKDRHGDTNHQFAEFLKSLEVRARDTTKTITIKMKADVDFDEDVDILEAFKHFEAGKPSSQRKPYSPYCHQSGRPALTLGNMIGRKKIHEEAGGLTQFRPITSFDHIQQYGVIMANGVHLDYQREIQFAGQLMEKNHEVVFFKFADTVIIAGLSIDPSLKVNERFRLTNSTICTLKIWLENSTANEPVEIRATVFDNIFGLSEKYVPLLVHPSNASHVAQIAEPFETGTPKKHQAAIKLRIGKNPVRRRMDTIKLLCSPNFSKWHDVLLAREPSSLARHNIVDPQHQDTRKALNAILHHHKLKWNPDQMHALRLLPSPPGRIGIVEGVTGAGKSFVICAAATFFMSLKIGVLITVPSNAAGDSLIDKILEWNELTGFNVPVVRAYTKSNETRQFLKDARDAEDIDSDIQYEQGSEDAEHAVLLQAIISIKKKYSSRRYKLVAYSLERAVMDNARNPQHDIKHTMTAENILLLHKEFAVPMPEGFKTGEGGDKRGNVFVYQIIKRYLQELEDKPDFSKWADGLLVICKKVFNWAMEDYVRYTKVIVSTSINTGADAVAHAFADTLNKVVILNDEHFREDEISALVPITRLENSDKVEAFFAFGDGQQPGPLIQSAQDFPAINEFAQQLTMPFASRLIRTKFPQVIMWTQNRMTEKLAAWPNENSYRGRMKTSEAAKSQVVNPKWISVMREFLGDDDKEHNLSLTVISPVDSDCYVPEGTTSRINMYHVEVILKLVLMNQQGDGYKGDDICVMTMYGAQAAVIRTWLFRLQQKGYLRQEFHPKVETTNSFQGNQALWIIGDVVISAAHTKTDMGHTAEDSLFTVFTTRARHACTIVMSDNIGAGSMGLQHEEAVNKGKGRGMKTPIAPVKYLSSATAGKYIYNLAASPDLPDCINIEHREKPGFDTEETSERVTKDGGAWMEDAAEPADAPGGGW